MVKKMVSAANVNISNNRPTFTSPFDKLIQRRATTRMHIAKIKR